MYLTPIEDVIEAVVTTLRAMPDVVERFGGDPDSGIVPQADSDFSEDDLTQAIDGMSTPSLLVVYDGFSPGGPGGTSSFSHSVSLVMRLQKTTEYHAAAHEILTGVPILDPVNLPDGDGLSFLVRQIHENLLPTSLPVFTRLSDGNGAERWQMTLSYAEAGG